MSCNFVLCTQFTWGSFSSTSEECKRHSHGNALYRVVVHSSPKSEPENYLF
ncbi:14964_t:CDS:1, partial [Acaulospora morrowiae]